MCIRDRGETVCQRQEQHQTIRLIQHFVENDVAVQHDMREVPVRQHGTFGLACGAGRIHNGCLLYTSKAIKDGEMGEDDGDRLLKELDKVTKQTTDELDTLLEAKQKEIMEV